MEERLSTEVILKETIKQKETIIEEQNIKVSNTDIIILVLVLRLLQEPSIPYLDLFRPLLLKTIKKRIPINLHKNICTQ